MDIYQSLFEEVFEDDNYAWNPDIVNQYIGLLIKRRQFKRAIEAKYKFIAFMKKQMNVDHQVRRSYLEIICILITNEDYIKLDEVMSRFLEDTGSTNSDEY